MLTTNFSEAELNYYGAPVAYRGNIKLLAEMLQSFRNVVGVPFIVSSGYRSVEHNAEVGGSSTSEHTVGRAADFTPQGMAIAEFLAKVAQGRANLKIPKWGQMIVYPFTTGHVHLSLPSANHENEILVRLAEGGYAPLSGQLAASLPKADSALVVLFGIALVFLLSKGTK